MWGIDLYAVVPNAGLGASLVSRGDGSAIPSQ